MSLLWSSVSDDGGRAAEETPGYEEEMTLAVLLIVGAAVIGPIDAQIHDDPTDKFTVCPYERGRTEVRRCRSIPGIAETVAELCARAMKEIGAEYNNALGWFLSPETTSVVATPVRCIPVPEGYRR